MAHPGRQQIGEEEVTMGSYGRSELVQTEATASGRFQQAVDGFQRRVQSVADDQWDSQTPCTEWDVRALVNHVVGELRWIPPLLAGRTIADVGDELTGDLLGQQPKAAWNDASRSAIAASLQPGAMERTVHLSSGDGRADAYLSEVAADVTIHTWDLARAIGADERLDAGLVQFAQTTLQSHVEEWRAAGALGAAVDLPRGADPQDAFLALVGRRTG